MASQITVCDGLVVEQIGDELLVVVPGQSDVVRLTGEVAEVFQAIRSGHSVSGHGQIVTTLADLGLVVVPSGLSRRSLVKAGAVGAGVGIAVLAMPTVAAASSASVVTLTGGTWNWGLFGDPDSPDNAERGVERSFFLTPDEPLSGAPSALSTADGEFAFSGSYSGQVGEGMTWTGPKIDILGEPEDPYEPPQPDVVGEFTMSGAPGVTYRVTFVFSED
jgi:hypothetical protein